MAVNGNAKGKVGEREVAELMRKNGFEARRGQQFSGGGDSPDVVHNMKGFHIEVKRTGKQTDIFKAMAQATRDKKQEDVPLVFHRKNNQDWVVVMKAKDFFDLMNKYVYEEVPPK